MKRKKGGSDGWVELSVIKGEVGCDLGKGRGLMNLAIEKWRVKMKKLSFEKRPSGEVWSGTFRKRV